MTGRDERDPRPSNEATAQTGDGMDRPTVDAERLAALMDGALSESERNLVLQSLASSPDSLEILAESAAVARDIEQPNSEKLSVGRRRSGWRRRDAVWLAAAAGLAGVAVLSWGVVYRQGRGVRDPSAFAKDLARQGAAIPKEWHSLGASGASLRGGEVVSDSQQRAARVGADISDLTVALAAHDERAASIANRIATLLESSPDAAAEPTAALFRQLGAEKELNDSTVAALTLAARSAAELTDAKVVNAGAWIEAARLAAHRRDSRFFRTKGSRDMLERLTRAGWLDDAAHTAARAVASEVRSPTPDWTSLGDHLTTLFASIAGPR